MKTAVAGMSAGLLLLSLGATFAQAEGMTLYTFDKDSGGTSSCYDDCATNWPPYLAKEGESLGEGWAMVARTDGTQQWAYDGKPVYTFVRDTDSKANGDGMNGWHALPTSPAN